jgi:hypothetical protein
MGLMVIVLMGNGISPIVCKHVRNPLWLHVPITRHVKSWP